MKPKTNKAYKHEQRRYAYGYVIAAGLSIAVYVVAVGRMFEGVLFAGVVLAAAALQLYVQSKYFLHLDDKSNRPRWKLMSYMFTWLTLLIIAVGSVWIMGHLNYNMGMSPSQMEDYMKERSLRGF